jgi:hypothetical protein
MLHFRLSILLCFALSAVESAYAAGPSVSPADSDVRQILVNRIDKDKQGVGIVVGAARWPASGSASCPNL